MFLLVPTVPLNVTVTTGDMVRTLIIVWEPPSSPGGIITTYMVIYNDTTVDTNNNDTSYTITGLDPYTNYSISIIACTNNGCGNQTDVITATTEEEGMVYFGIVIFLWFYVFGVLYIHIT